MHLYNHLIIISSILLTELWILSSAATSDNKYYLSVNNVLNKLSKRALGPSDSLENSNHRASSHLLHKILGRIHGQIQNPSWNDFQQPEFPYMLHSNLPNFSGRKYTVLMDVAQCPNGYTRVFPNNESRRPFVFCHALVNMTSLAGKEIHNTKENPAYGFKNNRSKLSESFQNFGIVTGMNMNEMVGDMKLNKRFGGRRLSIQGAMSSLAGMLKSTSSARRPTPRHDKERDTLKYKLFLIGK